MPLQVIGAGYFRTGTLSTKRALEQLGFGPCYHMEEVFKAGDAHVKFWSDVHAGKSVDFREFFSEYQATTDFPACAYYRELMEAFPDAKVIVTVRDPSDWHRSCMQTVYRFSHGWPAYVLWLYLPFVRRRLNMIQSIWDVYFGGQFSNAEITKARFIAHIEQVKSIVPANKLLIFNVAEGWEPLCRFLQVPIPATPFPNSNDSVDFEKNFSSQRFLASVFAACSVGVLGLGVWVASKFI